MAFVANGAVLPRRSGVSDKPLAGAVPFASPVELERTFDLPHAGPHFGHGGAARHHAYRRRRLPREVHPARSAAKRRVQPHRGRRARVRAGR